MHAQSVIHRFIVRHKRNKIIILPARPLVLNRLQYYMDELSADRFKDALFTDPSFVKKMSLVLEKNIQMVRV